jgi:hypothetical protein
VHTKAAGQQKKWSAGREGWKQQELMAKETRKEMRLGEAGYLPEIAAVGGRVDRAGEASLAAAGVPSVQVGVSECGSGIVSKLGF